MGERRRTSDDGMRRAACVVVMCCVLCVCVHWFGTVCADWASVRTDRFYQSHGSVQGRHDRVQRRQVPTIARRVRKIPQTETLQPAQLTERELRERAVPADR